MRFEIENTEAKNLPVINKVIHAILNFDVKSLSKVEAILERIIDKPNSNFQQYIWGRGGSHIWLSQNDGKRIIIFK